MTLAFWDVTKSHSSLSVGIEANRLRIDNDIIKSSSSSSIVHLRKSSDLTRGHTIGLIQTKMEITDHQLSTLYEGLYGVMVMWSQADLTAGSGSAYAFGIRTETTPVWSIHKYTGSGVVHPQSPSADLTVLADGDTTLSPGVGINYTLSVQWAYNSLIGGTNLVCKVGLASDAFTNMTTIYDHTDMSSPLTTSVGEGLLYYDAEYDINDLRRVYYDDTTIVPYAGTPL